MQVHLSPKSKLSQPLHFYRKKLKTWELLGMLLFLNIPRRQLYNVTNSCVVWGPAALPGNVGNEESWAPTQTSWIKSGHYHKQDPRGFWVHGWIGEALAWNSAGHHKALTSEMFHSIQISWSASCWRNTCVSGTTAWIQALNSVWLTHFIKSIQLLILNLIHGGTEDSTVNNHKAQYIWRTYILLVEGRN